MLRPLVDSLGQAVSWSGPRMVVRPSGWVKVKVPAWWVIVMCSVWIQSWQAQQRRPEFSTEVAPPGVQGIRWWTSQSRGGAWQPGPAAGAVAGDDGAAYARG